MKRWAIRICVLLLLGAIINVAVAWAAAAWIEVADGDWFPGGSDQSYRTSVGAPAWEFSWLTRTGACRYIDELVLSDVIPRDYELQGRVRSDLVPRWSLMRDSIPISTTQARRVHVEDVRGWPMLAMRCVFEIEFAGTNGFAVGVENGIGYENINARGLPGARATTQPFFHDFLHAKALPLQPVWPGFVINTLFYAMIVYGIWLFFTAPFAIRRRSRTDRGLCPKCAYDLRGSDSQSCPECGAAVRLQRIN